MTQTSANRDADETPPTGETQAADATPPPGDGPADEAASQPDETEAPAEETPEEQIAALKAEVARLNREYLGALADAQNAKRMADKRIQDNSKYAVSNLAKALLPVADNMERALAAAPEGARESDANLNNLAIGVEMTAKELAGALAQYGVKRLEAMNQPFDPNLHQAMQEMDDPSVPAGTVIQVYQTGYTIHDRLLRPAMVVVSKGGPKRVADDAGAAGEGAGGAAPGGGVDTSA
jgi:molecular chaperone GrpE